MRRINFGVGSGIGVVGLRYGPILYLSRSTFRYSIIRITVLG